MKWQDGERQLARLGRRMIQNGASRGTNRSTSRAKEQAEQGNAQQGEFRFYVQQFHDEGHSEFRPPISDGFRHY